MNRVAELQQQNKMESLSQNTQTLSSGGNSTDSSPSFKENMDLKQSQYKYQQEELRKDDQKNSLPVWQTTWHYKFIQYWQTVFNRRVASFSCFALQIGDMVIFSLVIAFLIFCCFKEQNTNSSGEMAGYMMAVTIIFGCRNGLLSYIFGLSLERAVLWHQLIAWVTLGLSINHWIHSRGIMSGYVIQGVLMAFIAFSIKPIRRYVWELFMKIHWILIAIMVVGCIVHKVTVGLIATIYFLLDICYRLYTVYKHRNISQEMKLERIGTNIVKISMKKNNCNYKGGQYFFIMIPKLSYFQWHPFSVFSASQEEEIVIYVKTLGDWTSLLYKYAGEPGKPQTLKGYLEGPYGSHSISIEGDKYQNFLCISGGIGVTPIASLAKEILNQMDQGRPVKNLHFIWTGRDSAIVESVFKPDDLRSLLNQKDLQIIQTFYHYSIKGDKKIEDIEQQALKVQQEIVKLEQDRPDFQKYFEIAFQKAQECEKNLVGVLVCGPQQLIDAVEINAQKWSKKGVRFDVHQEVFDF